MYQVKENESNLHNHEESSDVEINEAEEKTADFESGVNPDEVLKHPGLSQKIINAWPFYFFQESQLRASYPYAF